MVFTIRFEDSLYFLSKICRSTRSRSAASYEGFKGKNKIAIYKLQIKPNAIKGRELTLFDGKSEMQRVSVSQAKEAFLKRCFSVS